MQTAYFGRFLDVFKQRLLPELRSTLASRSQIFIDIAVVRYGKRLTPWTYKWDAIENNASSGTTRISIATK